MLLTRCDEMPEFIRAQVTNEPTEKRTESVEYIQPADADLVIDLISEDEQEENPFQDTKVFTVIKVPCTSSGNESDSFTSSAIVSSTPKPIAERARNEANRNARLLLIGTVTTPNERSEKDNVPTAVNGAQKPNKNQNNRMAAQNSGNETPVTKANVVSQANDPTISQYYTARNASSSSLPTPNNTIGNSTIKQTFDRLAEEDERLRQNIKDLKNELTEKIESEQNLQRTIAQLKSTVEHLNTELVEKNDELNQLKSTLDNSKEDSAKKDTESNLLVENLRSKLQEKILELVLLKDRHDAVVKRAIEDTKAKKWCVKCNKEAPNNGLNPPVCSSECLLGLW